MIKNAGLKIYNFHFEWFFWWILVIVVVNFQIVIVIVLCSRVLNVLHVSHRHRLIFIGIIFRITLRQWPTNPRFSITVIIVILKSLKIRFSFEFIKCGENYLVKNKFVRRIGFVWKVQRNKKENSEKRKKTRKYRKTPLDLSSTLLYYSF